MKKILSIILILLIAMNLSSCHKKETAIYEFKYKFKEEYSDIDRDMAATFIEMVKKLPKVYDTVLDPESQDIDDEFSMYVEDYFIPLNEKVTTSVEDYSKEEIETMKHMLNIVGTTAKLGMMKAEYHLDKINDEMGLKKENEEEYYMESAQNFKKEIEKLFEETKQFID